ncbi:Anaerobic nitric oxide reductase flavorubredoxin [Serratia fonticola]|uniref:Anaerobic nitric oxide reductase flavorubredoxin n=1 Tax=Serratia fonticola TaxID=47917 RepID=A0A4U9VXF3_SERFO|nr:Anaerobic nitric oxide reductase flavorubredoxin [Serratia fonticola]
MAIQVKNNIQWVGQRDWEVRDFHGTEYKTLKGSSYNSYLIREEKTVLIDTVDPQIQPRVCTKSVGGDRSANAGLHHYQPCRRRPCRCA